MTQLIDNNNYFEKFNKYGEYLPRNKHSVYNSEEERNLAKAEATKKYKKKVDYMNIPEVKEKNKLYQKRYRLKDKINKLHYGLYLIKPKYSLEELEKELNKINEMIINISS